MFFLSLFLERTIEDHESVMEVLTSWGLDTDSRLYFRKNYAKYEFFKKPLVTALHHQIVVSPKYVLVQSDHVFCVYSGHGFSKTFLLN